MHTIGLVDSIFDMAAPCIPDSRREEYAVSAGLMAERFTYRFDVAADRVSAVQSLLYCASEFMTFEREDAPRVEQPVDGGPGWEG